MTPEDTMGQHGAAERRAAEVDHPCEERTYRLGDTRTAGAGRALPGERKRLWLDGYHCAGRNCIRCCMRAAPQLCRTSGAL